MSHFHICYSGHDCDNNKAKQNLREVGEKIVFDVGQFKASVNETIAVRVVNAYSAA